ncbi:hypothetical protein [Ornithinimicrobium sp. INDO-MA30-4]|uniref:hypothetical protein n=1 Tax=Ornithinimicrobium sp. INDO-MA30-4 TaxID=2908651 RepID=UPI001F2B5B0C|nr:hypothetical protein [Ornithinimicrobium sp. INDO-MA30-4]UJH70458.1 hypothetical protein L0A91_15320 [Ornithinimicrobium sp. INDO-MA30-4]
MNTRERTDEGREVRTITNDPERAHWVPWIFDKYASGDWTVVAIRDELNRNGVSTLPTPKRGASR